MHISQIRTDGANVVPVSVTDAVITKAKPAVNFIRSISHEGRLMILCHLLDGEKSVVELERLICAKQASVSQQLLRLRRDGFVKSRKTGRNIYYTLDDRRVGPMVSALSVMFATPH